MLNGERLEAFPLRSGTRQGCPLRPVLFNIVSDVLVNAVRQVKETKCIDWEGRNKAVRRRCVCLCRKSERINRLLELRSNYSKVAGYTRLIDKSQLLFLCARHKQVEFEI